MLWNCIVQCDHMMEAIRPDIVAVDKIMKETMIIDIAIPGHTRLYDKEQEKIEEELVKRRNWQIMANEKGHCDFHCSWSIKNYNCNVWEVH